MEPRPSPAPTVDTGRFWALLVRRVALLIAAEVARHYGLDRDNDKRRTVA